MLDAAFSQVLQQWKYMSDSNLREEGIRQLVPMESWRRKNACGQQIRLATAGNAVGSRNPPPLGERFEKEPPSARTRWLKGIRRYLPVLAVMRQPQARWAGGGSSVDFLHCIANR